MTLAILPYNSHGDFNPDLLLFVFARCLASKRLSLFDVKAILEEEGFFEPGKCSIEEMDAAFCKMVHELEPVFKRWGWGDPPTHDSEPRPPPDAPKYHRLRDALDGIQALMRMPQAQESLWKLPPKALMTSMDEDLAKEYYAVLAARQLLAVKHPEVQNVTSNLDKVLARLARANRNSAHRPPSNKNATRFRTAAVAAAECYRATGVSPRDSRQWVATCLNRAGLRRDTAGSLFKPKTIQNWSSKGEYEESLLKGMRVLWSAPRFAGVDRRLVAQIVIDNAIFFAKLSQEKKLLNCLC
jgi:hypothetical protein